MTISPILIEDARHSHLLFKYLLITRTRRRVALASRHFPHTTYGAPSRQKTEREETISSLFLSFPPPLLPPPVSYMPYEGQYEPDEILARSQRGNEATIFDPQRDKKSVGAVVENARETTTMTTRPRTARFERGLCVHRVSGPTPGPLVKRLFERGI